MRVRQRLGGALLSALAGAALLSLLLLGPAMAQSELPCPLAVEAEKTAGRSAALAAYDLCLETAALSARQRAEAQLARGLIFLAEGRRQCALADFDQAIWLAPAFAAAYVARGQAHLAQGGAGSLGSSEGKRGCRAGPGQLRGPGGGTIQETKAGGARVAGQSFPDRRTAERWLAQQQQIAALQRQVAALQQRLAAAEPAPQERLLPLDQPPLREPGAVARGLADFGRALQLEPGMTSALKGRAVAHCRLGQAEAAQADWLQLLRRDARLAGTLQEELLGAGFYRGAVDGVFGPQSKAALAAFAASHCS